jgi:hypothetical protein
MSPARRPHSRPSFANFGPALLALTAVALTACGSNKPELPPGASQPESCFAPAYPGAPYGNEPGSVLRNLCFQGWKAPDRVAHNDDTLEPVALSDFYDPDGARGVKVLLVNTAAVWCSACRIEHETLPEHARELGPRGLVILSALFQDQGRNPATVEDLSLWTGTFSSNFPMVLDPSYRFGRFASAETAPLNLVIDARSMTLIAKFVGDQAAVMWPTIEGALDRAE